MGITETALLLLGVGIISEQLGGGVGLQKLGTGVQSIVSAPLTGTGMGLSSLAGGIRDIAETFGDLGRGISALIGSFGGLQNLPGYVGPGGSGSGNLPAPGATLPGNGGLPPLITMSGGSGATLAAGGGQQVPYTPTVPLLPQVPSTPVVTTPSGAFLLGGSTSPVAHLVC